MSVVRFRPEAPISGFSSLGRAPPCQGGGSEFEPRNPLHIWRHSQAVRQRPAKPLSPVRFRVAPPENNPIGLFFIWRHLTTLLCSVWLMAYFYFLGQFETILSLNKTMGKVKSILRPYWAYFFALPWRRKL